MFIANYSIAIIAQSNGNYVSQAPIAKFKIIIIIVLFNITLNYRKKKKN